MANEAPDDIKRIIRERSDLFEKHFAAGDAAALVADYYVPDALDPLVSAPDAPAVRGRAAIAGLFGLFVNRQGRCRTSSAPTLAPTPT